MRESWPAADDSLAFFFFFFSMSFVVLCVRPVAYSVSVCMYVCTCRTTIVFR